MSEQIYTVADAIEMLRLGGVNFSSELENVTSAYADVTEEIERGGGSCSFSQAEFEAALRLAGRNEQ